MTQLQKHHTTRAETVKDEPYVAPEVDPEVEAHKAHSDELLDEIDALLEELGDAETFVKDFRQKGGE